MRRKKLQTSIQIMTLMPITSKERPSISERVQRCTGQPWPSAVSNPGHMPFCPFNEGGKYEKDK